MPELYHRPAGFDGASPMNASSRGIPYKAASVQEAHLPATAYVDSSDHECAIIAVSGRVSAAATGQLRSAMRRALAARPATIVVDLRAAESCEAAQATGLLVLMKRHARRCGASFGVAAPRWLAEQLRPFIPFDVLPVMADIRAARAGAAPVRARGAEPAH